MVSGWFEVLVLGVVQGLTEFLPVSSSGHLAVGQMLLGLREGNLALSVTLHAGTLLATFVYFRQQILQILRDVSANLARPTQLFSHGAGADARVAVLASIPTGVIGLLLEPHVERWTLEPVVVAAGFFVTVVLLCSTLLLKPGKREVPSNAAALLVGLAQACAVMPGVSRSGATIVALLALGVSSKRAFELSMLISLPAVLGAFLLELMADAAWSRPVAELVFGAVVAFAVGVIALRVLSHFVTRGRLAWFALWVVPLAVWVLLGGASG